MKTIVLSLGGSLIVPGKIDVAFLKDFKGVIEEYIGKGYKFAILCGGGRIARNYQKAASEICEADNNALDWLGISATTINAMLLKVIFGENAEKDIVDIPNKKITFNKKILVASGWIPGWSTDHDAVLLAKNLNVKKVVNMSNIDYVYDKDPKKFKDAKKIERISWEDYRKVAGDEWKAGMNLPFDPVAAKEAQNSKIEVNVIGKDLKNFGSLLDEERFKGTIIK